MREDPGWISYQKQIKQSIKQMKMLKKQGDTLAWLISVRPGYAYALSDLKREEGSEQLIGPMTEKLDRIDFLILKHTARMEMMTENYCGHRTLDWRLAVKFRHHPHCSCNICTN